MDRSEVDEMKAVMNKVEGRIACSAIANTPDGA